MVGEARSSYNGRGKRHASATDEIRAPRGAGPLQQVGSLKVSNYDFLPMPRSDSLC